MLIGNRANNCEQAFHELELHGLVDAHAFKHSVLGIANKQILHQCFTGCCSRAAPSFLSQGLGHEKAGSTSRLERAAGCREAWMCQVANVYLIAKLMASEWLLLAF